MEFDDFKYTYETGQHKFIRSVTYSITRKNAKKGLKIGVFINEAWH